MGPIHPYIARLLVDERRREVGRAAAHARAVGDMRRAKRSARARRQQAAGPTAA